ncbi:hypothetical protein MKX03_008791 [Papaver bracteatum]|nr:hypothetical protein MKX03_008791 [Papaver bracteatum]
MLKLPCVVLACMVAVAPYAAEGAISCDAIKSKMTPCLGMLLNPSVAQESSLSLHLFRPLQTFKLFAIT